VPGPLALVGSGEYLPAMLDIERALIDGRPPRYVQIPTAAAPEGKATLQKWIDLGVAQAARMGVEAVTIAARDRDEADDAALAAQVEGAGLIYLSGGDPAYLADTLRDTKLWAAVVSAYEAGAALAGCSAGAMALTTWAPSPARMRGESTTPGLGLVPHLRVLPHFDRMPQWVPAEVMKVMVEAPHGIAVVGVDEETAIVGGPEEWEVQGRQSAWLLHPDGSREQMPPGTTFGISRA
jgi:cyanophycinase-like exopeptidase